MGRFVFPDLTTFRKRVTYHYEQHRKTINENLGLIIALLASAAAVWSGYEAHRSRTEARVAADRSLMVQQQSVDAQKKSVDAQIQATQLDERPFIIVDMGEIRETTQTSVIDLTKVTVFSTYLKYSVSGRTPAINVRFFSGYGEGTLLGSEVRKLLQTAVRQNENLTESLIYPGNSVSSEITYPEAPEGITFYGFVVYDDLFHVSHKTDFCYNAYNFLRTSKTKHLPVLCSQFIPEIT